MLGVDPTQSYGENTKSPTQDFHRIRYKNLYKLIFEIISHNYLLFSHRPVLSYSTISSWFWIETEKNNLLKLIFGIISHNYLLFLHRPVLSYFTISSWFWINFETEKNNLENFSKKSVIIKIFKFQDRRLSRLFTFHVITRLNFDIERKKITRISLKDPFKSISQTWKIPVVWEILVKISGGQNDPGVYFDQKSLVFPRLKVSKSLLNFCY